MKQNTKYKIPIQFRSIIKKFSTNLFTLELKDRRIFPNIEVNKDNDFSFTPIIDFPVSTIVDVYPSE